MVEGGPRVKIATDERTMSQDEVIVIANDAVISIPALTGKQNLTRDKKEGRGLYRN